jgi:hypothetical protein
MASVMNCDYSEKLVWLKKYSSQTKKVVLTYTYILGELREYSVLQVLMLIWFVSSPCQFRQHIVITCYSVRFLTAMTMKATVFCNVMLYSMMFTDILV